MRKRADSVGETRRRITEAAVELHTTVGPARTTISGVAERAGVTRLTVYRHFPTEEDLFAACTGHWMAQHPMPDPATWTAIPGLEARAEAALTAIYGWYHENADDLLPLRRDVDAYPPAFRDAAQQMEAWIVGTLIEGSGARGRARVRLRAASALVVSYWTWRALIVDQGLGRDEAIALGVRFLAASRD